MKRAWFISIIVILTLSAAALGRKHQMPPEPVTGPPVENAMVRARLVPKHGLRFASDPGWIDATTNNDGDAYWTFETGYHPGSAEFEFEVVSNPVNTWNTGPAGASAVEIQPGIRADDNHDQPPIKLEEFKALLKKKSAVKVLEDKLHNR